jgi:soluble lytic murein transglycosylase-like protein
MSLSRLQSNGEFLGSCLRVAAVVLAFCATTALLENASLNVSMDPAVISSPNSSRQDRSIALEELALPASNQDVSRVLYELCPTVASRGDDLHIQAAVLEASYRYSVSQELIFAVIAAESRCKKEATSRAGAMGLMQLMPSTASWLGVQRPYAIRDNILGGAKYLAYLIEFFNGDVELALAGYNAGPYRVRQFDGIPPFPETRKYVRRVLHFHQQLRTAASAERA